MVTPSPTTSSSKENELNNASSKKKSSKKSRASNSRSNSHRGPLKIQVDEEDYPSEEQLTNSLRVWGRQESNISKRSPSSKRSRIAETPTSTKRRGSVASATALRSLDFQIKNEEDKMFNKEEM
jgi:superfamily II DNA helicase RecQ